MVIHAPTIRIFLFLVICVFCPHAALCEDRADTGAGETVPVVLFPRQEVTVYAEVSTKVKKILKDMGESFKEKETLIQFEASLFVARKIKAEAELKAAEAVLSTIEKLYADRSKSMAEVMRARAEAAQAQAVLKIAEYELAACSVDAPYPGKVKKVFVNEYELVQRGQKLVSIVDDRKLRARFLAPAAWLHKIKTAQTVIMKIGNFDKPVEGIISHISPSIDPASQTFEVFAEVDNSRYNLSGGAVGVVELREPETPEGEADER